MSWCSVWMIRSAAPKDAPDEADVGVRRQDLGALLDRARPQPQQRDRRDLDAERERVADGVMRMSPTRADG
jgi:hypothetical protein